MKQEPSNEEYNDYVEQVTPKHSCFQNCLWAFLIGGIICTIGEGISQLLQNFWGLGKDDAGSYVSVILVALSVILTGFNLYGSIAKLGGAGALVPITGFANSVAAPCIEYQKEGQVFGIGVKVFTIAGPVILYGIVTSFVLGFIYWIGKMWGWF
ncbi:MAG: stage V sporulation protein AC [Lachnospiraceae bacterium]|nr:stage V sporulation protein AC [Lachnospiraceae bacterium]MBP3507398.1 stage V sporulation protein AC [Lachnospiraceae bacterium]